MSIDLCSLCQKPLYSPLEVFADTKPIHMTISLCSFRCLGMFKISLASTTCTGPLKERVMIVDEQPKQTEKKE